MLQNVTYFYECVHAEEHVQAHTDNEVGGALHPQNVHTCGFRIMQAMCEQ